MKENKIDTKTVRVGYFSNITHAQALIGFSNGTFQKYIGEKVKLESKIFNAGPSEIEALFAGAIDIGYVGPSPAINGYVKSNGEALRIVSGSASGGTSLILQPELGAAYTRDGARVLIGKKIASPQQGNTQDISLRHFLKNNFLSNKTNIVPIVNADQMTLFLQKQIDGAWAPEPWASFLVKDAGGTRVLDERELWSGKIFCTTNIVVSTKFLQEEPELVEKWLRAHVDITDWINSHPEESQKIVNAEIGRITTKRLPLEIIQEAWGRLNFTTDPIKESVYIFADWAREEGFLDKEKDLDNLYDLNIINHVRNIQY